MAALQELIDSLKGIGLRRTLQVIAGRFADFRFDARHGTDTVRNVRLQDLRIEHDTRERGTRYQATGVLAFRKLLRLHPLPPGRVLVDFGSGKGRVLLLAAHGPFKKVVGIEFSHELIEIARRNIELYRRRHPSLAEIELIEADVARYNFKDDEDVFYFFHPFDEEILRTVVRNISASLARRPRPAWLVYYYPIHRGIIEREAPAFRLLGEHVLTGHDWLVYGAEGRK